MARALAVVVVLAAIVFGYRWWNSPRRQINRVLDAIAAGVSHEQPAEGLGAVAAVAGLQQYFTTDVAIEAGGGLPVLVGRDSVLGAAARIRIATPSLALTFVDRQIAIGADGASATVNCTVSATSEDRAGQRNTDARQVVITLRLADGRWLIERAAAVNVLEPVT